MHQRLIHRYREAVESIMLAATAYSDEELDYRPAHRGWSARELVRELMEFVRPSSVDWTGRQLIHHLADAELEDAVKLRRILAENTPVLHPWDDEHYSKHLHYDRPVAISLAAFQATALANIELLERLSPDEWQREANFERPWTETIESWLESKLIHMSNRMMQIINAVGDPHRDE